MNLIILAAIPALAALTSEFPSTVKGINIPNTHIVAQGQGLVLRGSAPGKRVSELVEFGVTDVLVFKNETGHEVQQECDALLNAGLPQRQILAIPFRWEDMPTFEETCQETVQALQFLQNAYDRRGRTAYFHCTMGEDRTGYLAGLFRMLNNGLSARAAFEEEMCAHGYEAANHHKPTKVVRAIRRELTPAFLKMASLIESGRLRGSRLDSRVCSDPSADQAVDSAGFHCK